MTTHSLPNLLTKVKQTQNQMNLGEVRKASQSASAFRDLYESLQEQIIILAQGIERDLAARELTAADLAIRSRRGYQWFKFLSDPSSLSFHLDFLQRVNFYLEQKKHNDPANFAVSLYHQGSLYRISQKKNFWEIRIQEGFLTAPDRVINAFLEISLDPSLAEARAIIRDYTFQNDYRKYREHLEYLGIPRGRLAKGQVHDLLGSFQRVNETYFKGKMVLPHLIWNNRLTHRKFGHYQWDTDTIMISRSLDQRRIPELVLDFVMYHELLHKDLGLKFTKQNRIAHTREFRTRESQFKDAEKARQQLNRIARKRKRGPY
jgi:hypothetical protein